MPYFHFCMACRERLYSTSRMTIDHRCPQCGGRLMPYHLVSAPGPTRRRRGRSYASLADFYNGDRRRLASPERDVGLYWRDGAGEPLHRAAWVEDTGELYIVRADDGEAGGGRVEGPRGAPTGPAPGWRGPTPATIDSSSSSSRCAGRCGSGTTLRTRSPRCASPAPPTGAGSRAGGRPGSRPGQAAGRWAPAARSRWG